MDFCKKEVNEPNESQQKVINTVDRPVLVIAALGAGKTKNLVDSTIHRIKDIGVEPNSIFIATFIEKAAKELKTRIADKLYSLNL